MMRRVAEGLARLGRRRPGRRLSRRARARRLSLMVAALGVGIAGAFLTMPVDADLDGDPLLRLRAFDAAPQAAMSVECGTALGGPASPLAGASLYDLASQRACRHATDRRLLSAAAGGGVVALSGVLALLAASGRLRRPALAP